MKLCSGLMLFLSIVGYSQSYTDHIADSLSAVIRSSDEAEVLFDANLALGRHLIGKDSTGISFVKEAIRIGENNTNQFGCQLSVAYWAYGMYYLNSDLGYQKQLNAQKKAKNYARKFCSKEKLANSLVALGNVFTNSNLDSTMYYFEEAIQIFDSLGIESAGLYENLGNVNFHLDGDPWVTIGYYKEAERISYNTADTTVNNILFFNISLAYMTIPEPDSALKYLEKSFAFARRNPDNPYNLEDKDYYRRKGNIYVIMGEYELAIPVLQKAIDEIDPLVNFDQAALVHNLIGKAYIKRGKPKKAENNLLQAISIAKSHNLLQHHLDGVELMYQVNARQGNLKNALSYLEQTMHLKDSVTSMELAKKDQQEKDLLKSSQQLKELENEILRKERSIQESALRMKNYILYAVVAAIFLGAIFIVILYRSSKKYKRLSNKLTRANVTIVDQKEKLEELDKVKSRFFQNISHDLRSPLTLILGALNQTVEKDSAILDKESLKLIDIGIGNCKRLLFLANEILDLTRLEEGKLRLEKEQVKIAPYMRFLIGMFSSAADLKKIALEFTSEISEETLISADPQQFEKIIYNLISNAIKFTPEEGRIDVHLVQSSQEVSITIKDTGSGIPNESIKYIFDRYYQSADNPVSAQSGLGIGLALVKELVELHEAKITVSSGIEGTSFTIQIPISDEQVEGVVPAGSLQIITKNSLWTDLHEEAKSFQFPTLSNGNPNASTVLVVEDHRELRLYLRGILVDDFKVLEAQNGEHALQILETQKVDLILTDLMMPYLDGFGLLDKLKENKELKNTPVLVISARTDKTEKVQLMSQGAEVMQKPFEKDELIAKINNMLKVSLKTEFKVDKMYKESDKEYEKNMLEKIEKLILKNIDNQSFSVYDIGDEIAASERNVYRLVKKLVGITPKELIMEIRWQYFEKFLSENSVSSLSEAAKVIGMTNASYFGRQYKKRFGKDLSLQLG